MIRNALYMFFPFKNNTKKEIDIILKNLIAQEKLDEIYYINNIKIYGNREINYPNIFGENINYKKFFILCEERAGSSFLINLLQSHPNIVCYQELFSEDKCYFHYPFFPEETNQEMLSIRNNMPGEFLKSVIYRKYLPDFKAVGFKMAYNQTQNKNTKPAWKLLLKDKDVCVLHLIRNNYLNSLISLKTTIISGIYTIYNTSDRYVTDEEKQKKSLQEQTINSIKFELDFEETKNYFIKTEKNILRYRHTIRKHPSLEIIYENITTDPVTESNKILSFLGIEKRILTNTTIKLNKRKAIDIITNYSELKRLFSD